MMKFQKTIRIDKDDGVKHINVYSHGQTTLGRMLSNFNLKPGDLPEGNFQSMEGYWYYLALPDIPEKEILKTLTGWNAKSKGMELAKQYDEIFFPEFPEKIGQAITKSIYNNPQLVQEIKNNNLPLKHYYVYGEKKIFPKGLGWYLNTLNKICEEIKNENSQF